MDSKMTSKYKTYNSKIIIGLAENIKIDGPEGSKDVMAKIDTGATKSSIDSKLAAELRLGPIIRTRLVKSAHGNSVRPVIDVTIELAEKKIKEQFTIANRDHMKYPVLLGQNILKKHFLIDPSKNQ